MADNRDKLLEMLDEGLLDAKQLAKDLLGWLSEDDCIQFAHANDIQLEDEEPEYEYSDEDEVNEAFAEEWEQCCNDQPSLRKDKPAKREAYALFIDSLQREGKISEDLANDVTLSDDD